MATLKDVVTAAVGSVADTIKKKKNTETTTTNDTSTTSSTTSSGASSNSNELPYKASDRDKSTGKGTSTNYGTYQDDLDRLTNAQRQAQVSQLKAARKKALANLDVQEQNIKPMYESARNQTSAASQQGARNFAEYLANRGLTNSGAAAQGEINRLSALNNNLGNLNTAEANAYRDIANQRTAVENDYVAGLANANNAITQNYYNNLLNYNEQQRQMVQALQNQALGQYANDYAAYRNQLLAQGYDPNSLEVLSVDALRGQKMNNQYNTAMQNAYNNILAGNINYNNAAAMGMTEPQAWNTYNTNQAALQAEADAKAEQLAYDRNQQEWKNNLDYEKYLLDKQKVENDTKETNWRVSVPKGGGKGNKNNYLSFDKALDYINNSDDPKATANALVDYGYIDEDMWNYIYDTKKW